MRNSKLWTLMSVLLVVAFVMSACGTAATPTAEEEPVVEEPQAVVEEEMTNEDTLKACFVYVGPIEDLGWTSAHDAGRLYVDDKYDWLETAYVESVAESDAARFLDRFVVEENCDVNFTTSFGYMEDTLAAAEKYPDSTFVHVSGYLRAPNMGNMMADFYQIYYLNGLMAGALTQSGKIGYVGAQAIPEVIRHIDAFTQGVREVNPEATVDVRWLYSWYDPAKSREAAESLIAEGADVLAFTEDSATVVQVGEEYTTEKDQQIYTFGHYSPMAQFGPNSIVSGQLVDWGLIYEDILTKIHLGIYDTTNMDSVDYWGLLGGGWLVGAPSSVYMGAANDMEINPIFEEDLKAVMVNDPVLGEISVYDLVYARIGQMKDPAVLFDPFEGPINDQSGAERVVDGQRLTYFELTTIDWFVEGVIGSPE